MLGRIHMQKQDLSKLQLRKLRAFKRKPGSSGNEEEAAEEDQSVNGKKMKANDQIEADE